MKHSGIFKDNGKENGKYHLSFTIQGDITRMMENQMEKNVEMKWKP